MLGSPSFGNPHIGASIIGALARVYFAAQELGCRVTALEYSDKFQDRPSSDRTVVDIDIIPTLPDIE